MNDSSSCSDAGLSDLSSSSSSSSSLSSSSSSSSSVSDLTLSASVWVGVGDGVLDSPNLSGFLTRLPDLVYFAPLPEGSPCWEEIANGVLGPGVPSLPSLLSTVEGSGRVVDQAALNMPTEAKKM